MTEPNSDNTPQAADVQTPAPQQAEAAKNLEIQPDFMEAHGNPRLESHFYGRELWPEDDDEDD